MIRFKVLIFTLISGTMLAACATFIKDDDVLSLKNYEKNIYMLKEDIGEGKFALKKAEKVKLYIVTGDNFVKVYCYPADVKFLKSERTLLLYLFEEDFDADKFNIDYFNEMLFRKIEAVE